MSGCRAFLLIALPALAASASAQDPSVCALGPAKEHVPPQYPIQLHSHPLEGAVTLPATFAPDGRVTDVRALAGPHELQFEARAYVNGWRVAPSTESRTCPIFIEYRFDGSQGLCKSVNPVHIAVERDDDQHVLLRLSCDLW